MNTHKSRFSKISNNIFLISVLSSIIFIWINYYIRNLYLSLTSTIVIVSFFCIIYYPVKFKLNKKYSSSQQKQIDKDQFKLNLLFGKYDDNVIFLSTLFNLRNLTPINNHFTSENGDIYFLLDKEELSENDIVNAIKNRINNTITIFCINSTKFPKLQNIDINIKPADEIFTEYCSQETISITDIKIQKSPKLRAKEYLCIIFSRERSRGYIGFGLLLLLSSLFTPYHTYYIIVGTILLLASIYARFNTRFN